MGCIARGMESEPEVSERGAEVLPVRAELTEMRRMNDVGSKYQ